MVTVLVQITVPLKLIVTVVVNGAPAVGWSTRTVEEPPEVLGFVETIVDVVPAVGVVPEVETPKQVVNTPAVPAVPAQPIDAVAALETPAKPSGPSALQTLSILLYPRALDAISRSAVPDASQLSGITRIGEEFYQMAINTVLADPSKLSTVYYPKLIKNNNGGTGASVYFELTPYDSEDPGALGSPFYAARVQIAEREKPVTII